MKQLLALSMLCLLLSSTKIDRSIKILSRHQMACILVDLELVKAMVQHSNYAQATATLLLRNNNLRIYQAYSTDQATFQASYQYYLDHPQVMEHIYEVVIDKLKALLTKV